MSQYVTTPDGQRHKFPDEATPEQMQRALSQYRVHSTPPMAMTDQYNPLTSAAVGLRERALGFLPTAGGFAGGLIGGAAGGFPGSIAGAGIGGAAGEGIRELSSGSTPSPFGIGTRGVEQAGYEAIGGGLARGAGALARPLMRRAMGVGKSLISNFPDAVETALSHGLPVTAKGAAKAKALRKASSQELDRMLQQAKAAGVKFNTIDITKHVRELLRSEVLPGREKERIARQLTDFLRDRGQFGPSPASSFNKKIDPVLLKEIKQFYQNRASSIYKAERAGALTMAQENRGLFSRNLAQGAREQLERIPKVGAQEARTQSLIGTQRALSEAAMRPPRPFEIHKPGSYPILNNPHVVSRVALTLNSQKFKSLLRQNPRAAAALVMEMTMAPADATLQEGR